MAKKPSGGVEAARIESRIFLLRAERVVIDADLAQLYGVSTKRLNEQVKRNRGRFPKDFMFRLTAKEKAEVVANCDHLAHLRYASTSPYAFTEHGAIQAANVLSSARAVQMSVRVVRAFIRMRALLAHSKQVAGKLAELERRIDSQDEALVDIVKAIRQLMASPVPTEPTRRRIGFI